MRKGSLEYWPHRRAKRQMPRVRSLPRVAEPSFLSFVGFKAGMTHVIRMEEQEGPSKGGEVYRPVTILEIPKVHVYGMRFYKRGYVYKEIAGEFYDANTAKKVGIEKIKNNDLDAFKHNPKEYEDVTALAFLDASNLGFGNKRVMRFEIPVGGKNTSEKMGFIEGFLGKEIKLIDFIKPGEFIDVTSISKGKGWAGVIKRYGVARQVRKATNKVRHVGTLGPWHPPKVMFGVPQSGHMGYNYRTELNKLVLKAGSPSESINVKGGYLNYGLVKSDYVMVEGSVPGPAKRLVRLRKSMRAKPIKEPQITYISLESKQGA